MMMRAEPEAINYSCAFNGFDTSSKTLVVILFLVLVNDLEDIFEAEKFKVLTEFIDLNRMMT